jgi:hypothetical protein
MSGFGKGSGGEADFFAALLRKLAASVEMTVLWFGLREQQIPFGDDNQKDNTWDQSLPSPLSLGRVLAM